MLSLQFVSPTHAKNPTLKKASTLYNCKGEGGGIKEYRILVPSTKREGELKLCSTENMHVRRKRKRHQKS